MKTHIARTTAAAPTLAPLLEASGAGFSIVEMLIATVIMMAVTGGDIRR